jgi:hypothetical protein
LPHAKPDKISTLLEVQKNLEQDQRVNSSGVSLPPKIGGLHYRCKIKLKIYRKKKKKKKKKKKIGGPEIRKKKKKDR